MFGCCAWFCCADAITLNEKGFSTTEKAKFVRYKHVLGRGAFSTIKKGEIIRWAGCSFKVIPIAIKSKTIDDNDWEETVREAKILLSLQECSFVVSLFGTQMLGKTLVLAYEFCLPNSIANFAQTIDPTFKHFTVLYFGTALISAVNHMHEKGIVHGDIKCSNIVVDMFGVPKLIDFASAHKQEILIGFYGTPGFVAPELYLSENEKQTFASDSFSVGVTLGCLMLDDTVNSWFKQLRKGSFKERYTKYNKNPNSGFSKNLIKSSLRRLLVSSKDLNLYDEEKKNILTNLVHDLVQFDKAERQLVSTVFNSDIVQHALSVFKVNGANDSTIYQGLVKIKGDVKQYIEEALPELKTKSRFTVFDVEMG